MGMSGIYFFILVRVGMMNQHKIGSNWLCPNISIQLYSGSLADSPYSGIVIGILSRCKNVNLCKITCKKRHIKAITS